jgi:hypothetical protein
MGIDGGTVLDGIRYRLVQIAPNDADAEISLLAMAVEALDRANVWHDPPRMVIRIGFSSDIVTPMELCQFHVLLTSKLNCCFYRLSCKRKGYTSDTK